MIKVNCYNDFTYYKREKVLYYKSNRFIHCKSTQSNNIIRSDTYYFVTPSNLTSSWTPVPPPAAPWASVHCLVHST